MIRKLSLALLLLLIGPLASARSQAPAAQAWGDFSGTFVYSGVQPAAKDESLVVDPKTGGLANVFVWLVVPKGEKLAVHPGYANAANATIELKFEQHRFSPHALTLRTSQKLNLNNLDEHGHTPTIEPRVNPPMSMVLLAGKQHSLQLSKPEQFPFILRCVIENTYAPLLVQDHPYMAVTDAEGKFSIKNLPVGKSTFGVWHEKSGFVDSVTIGTVVTDWTKGKLVATIKLGANDLGEIRYGGGGNK